MINPEKPDYSNTPASSQRPHYHYQLEDPHADPVITIVTPFFNTGSIFHETARTVFRQSLQQWEWIIVNDGSTDREALALLDEYRRMDPRIRVIDHPENKGLPAARNTGGKAAATKYILYLDSDDLLEPTAAEKWFWFLESHPEYSFAGDYTIGFGARQYLWRAGFHNNETNLEENKINFTVAARKQTLDDVGWFDESMRSGIEDWEFLIRSAARGYWGASVPEFLHWYRTRDSHTDRWEALQENRLRDFREKMQSLYPQLWNRGFPHPKSSVDLDLERIQETIPVENRLQKRGPRLLIIAPWMVVGGSEKFNLDLIRELIKNGWEISIATTIDAIHPWQHEFETCTPDVFPMNTFLDWCDYPRFLRYLVQSRQVDAILLSACQEGYRLLPYLRIHCPEVPILDYIHFVTPDWMYGGFPRMSNMFQSSLDLSVVTSGNVKRWMEKEGGDGDRIRVCTANIDTNFWAPDPEKSKLVRSELGISGDQTIILYVGRLEQQKQPRVFAQTMARLNQENLSFISYVVGDGSFRNWLEEYVSNNHLQNVVRFLGEVSNQRVHDLMTAGDIIFLPSENEGIALTFFEGMATGPVPVGADVGGQSELVTPDCGFLLPRGSEAEEAERYAEALAGLIRDPARRKQMSCAGRERVAGHFRLDQMGERMITLIQEAKQLHRDNPRCPSQKELASAIARQTMEFVRIRTEANRVRYSPLRTFLYFAVRKALMPIYTRLGGEQSVQLNKIRMKFRQLLLRTRK